MPAAPPLVTALKRADSGVERLEERLERADSGVERLEERSERADSGVEPLEERLERADSRVEPSGGRLKRARRRLRVEGGRHLMPMQTTSTSSVLGFSGEPLDPHLLVGQKAAGFHITFPSRSASTRAPRSASC